MQFVGWIISVTATLAAVSLVQGPKPGQNFMQAPKPGQSLVVNGKTVPARIIQSSDGRFYVDIDALAHAIGGSVAVQSNQIQMSVPQQQAKAGQVDAEALSRDFQRASITALGDMRQWVGAVSEVITTGVPVAGQWPREYRERVEYGLTQATVTASTNGDRETGQLLQMLYAKLGQWSDTVVAERNNLNGTRTLDPNALQNDRALAAIKTCGQFLGSMIVSGKFADDASCH